MDVWFYVLLGIKGFLIGLGFILATVSFLYAGALVGKALEAVGRALKRKGDEGHGND